MNKIWMSSNRLTEAYANGVEEFVNFAVRNAKDPARVRCPCIACLNANRKDAKGLKDDLIMNGIDETYTCWSLHLEKENVESTDDLEEPDFEADQIEEMIKVVDEDFDSRPEMLDGILKDAREPLYPSCTNFTKLSACLKLYNLKVSHGWTDSSFTDLLQLLKDILPKDNKLPDSTYKAKKMVRLLSLDYERIHACPNDCILYRNEYASHQHCPSPKCGASRYKRDGIPSKEARKRLLGKLLSVPNKRTKRHVDFTCADS